MGSPLRCTVLVPSFARPHHLRACLAGIAAQSRAADEVVVVLQTGDEPSWQVLDEHPWVRGVRVDRPGVVAAINAGLDAILAPAAAPGFVAICDDDAVPRPGWLAAIDARLQSDPGIGGVGGPDHPVPPPEVPHPPVERVGRFRWFGRMEGFHERGAFEAHEVSFLKGANHAYRAAALDGIRVDQGLRGDGAQVHNDLDLSLAVGQRWRLVFDPGVEVDHHGGPSPDRDLRERSPERTYDGGYNKVRVVRRHLGLARAMVMLPWDLACGDGYSPGPWRAHRLGLGPRRAVPMVLAASVGKLAGLVPRVRISLEVAATATGAVCVALVTAIALNLAAAIVAAMLAVWTGVAVRAPRAAIVAIVAYSGIVGWLRRIAEHALAGSGAGLATEMLLLPIPLVAGLLALGALKHGALRPRTPLLLAVSACLALAALGMFNPRQGSLLIGVAGFSYLGVPFLWFYAGRVWVDDAVLRRVFTVVLVVASMSAVYGVWGATGRYAPWDWAYYDTTDFIILFGDTFEWMPRPIGFMSSPEEFGRYLALAIVVAVCLLAPRVRGTGGWVGLGTIIGVLLAALLATGTRMSLGFLGIALVGVFAAWQGWSWRRAVTSVVVVALLVVGTAQVLSRLPDTGVWTVDRQVEGLARPWQIEHSTLVVHLGAQARFLRRGVTQPIGEGTGKVTPAADRFGGRTWTTEGDWSNAAAAWGLSGVIAYGAVLVFGIATALAVVARRRDAVALLCLAVLIVMAMRWSSGGIYALSGLVWLVLGWLDVEARRSSSTPDVVPPDRSAPALVDG